MLTTMNNHLTLVYLEFMSYVLSLGTDFNTVFQSETPLLHMLKPEVEKLLKTLSTNYMNISYVRSCQNILAAEFTNTAHFVDLDNIYIGMKASESVENLKKYLNVPRHTIADFYKSCQAFYIELTTDITKRFDFSDTLFSFISVVNPSEAQQLKVKSLKPLLQRFPILENVVTSQKLDDEWRAHAMLDYSALGLQDDDNPETYWAKVFSLKNSAGHGMFLNLKYAISLLLVLPFSNASVERKFSVLKNLKTENRNRLQNDTVVALMATKDGITKKGGSLKFEPSNDMLTKQIWRSEEL
ncbi:unnamed protein product [Diatraea saccharalis]|uniref:HAT C-terminal dimerisation domain-containing protein n=1 Tax=Diatraea saccharalis TaxID=40085 RepID=A0A9N9WAA1_9NEOP|nr:unnamed protein product [Diatraea saccharalis]